jgi:hypothetical protein
MQLNPGDIFVVKSKSKIAKAILAIEHVMSEDHEAEYTHAGIILGDNGDTFESLRHIDHYNMDLNKGCHIFIARHNLMAQEIFNTCMSSVIKYDGQNYPWWRLGLFFGGLADDLYRIDRPVCSELVALFLKGGGLRLEHSWGVSPDNLADEWHSKSLTYTTVFEGVWGE